MFGIYFMKRTLFGVAVVCITPYKAGRDFPSLEHCVSDVVGGGVFENVKSPTVSRHPAHLPPSLLLFVALIPCYDSISRKSRRGRVVKRGR